MTYKAFGVVIGRASERAISGRINGRARKGKKGHHIPVRRTPAKAWRFCVHHK